MIKIKELEKRWNANADRYNQWSELSLEEIVEFAQQECLKEASEKLMFMAKDSSNAN